MNQLVDAIGNLENWLAVNDDIGDHIADAIDSIRAAMGQPAAKCPRCRRDAAGPKFVTVASPFSLIKRDVPPLGMVNSVIVPCPMCCPAEYVADQQLMRGLAGLVSERG